MISRAPSTTTNERALQALEISTSAPRERGRGGRERVASGGRIVRFIRKYRRFVRCREIRGRYEATTSDANAERTDGGTEIGRRLLRSTQTWTKRPVAAGSSSPCRNSPISYVTDELPSFETRMPASTTSGKDSAL